MNPSTPPSLPDTLDDLPKAGDIVHVRERQYLVEDVAPFVPGAYTPVRLACLADDAQGEPLEVLWEAELDRAILKVSWDHLAHPDRRDAAGHRAPFDPPKTLRRLSQRAALEPRLGHRPRAGPGALPRRHPGPQLPARALAQGPRAAPRQPLHRGRRRPRQDHRGGPHHPRADDAPEGPQGRHRRPGQRRLPVEGRARGALRPLLRHPRSRVRRPHQDRARARRQPLEQPHPLHRQPRPAARRALPHPPAALARPRGRRVHRAPDLARPRRGAQRRPLLAGQVRRRLGLHQVHPRPRPALRAPHLPLGDPTQRALQQLHGPPREGFTAWLQALHDGSHGNADLVAHFFRRAFVLLRQRATLGLIASNTVSQGDTRATGLTWIRQHGGRIYDATKRLRWPGAAAVIVSVVHVRRGAEAPVTRLDGSPVAAISAFLLPGETDHTPPRIATSSGMSFIGSYVLGMGFTFDDASSREVAGTLADYERLYADPHNRSRLFPYIGGEELNADPQHLHRRYVINFEQMSESDAREWPDLYELLLDNNVEVGVHLRDAIFARQVHLGVEGLVQRRVLVRVR